MNRKPTGRVEQVEAGGDLILERSFQASAEDVWQSLTDSASTARWFGPWKGEPGIGHSIRIQMSFEEGKPWITARIDACEPPHQLSLFVKDDYGEWRLELRLKSDSGTTTLTFVQHLSDPKSVEDVGPGWEYYLDKLVAAERGEAHPEFDEYYPAMKAYYSAELVKSGLS